MALKIISIAALVIIGIIGFYFVLTSDRIDVDLYHIILYLLLGGLIIYFYIARLSNKD